MADDTRPKELTGAQALVESLERVGVDVIFGIPGGAVLPADVPLGQREVGRHNLDVRRFDAHTPISSSYDLR